MEQRKTASFNITVFQIVKPMVSALILAILATKNLSHHFCHGHSSNGKQLLNLAQTLTGIQVSFDIIIELGHYFSDGDQSC